MSNQCLSRLLQHCGIVEAQDAFSDLHAVRLPRLGQGTGAAKWLGIFSAPMDPRMFLGSTWGMTWRLSTFSDSVWISRVQP